MDRKDQKLKLIKRSYCCFYCQSIGKHAKSHQGIPWKSILRMSTYNAIGRNTTCKYNLGFTKICGKYPCFMCLGFLKESRGSYTIGIRLFHIYSLINNCKMIWFTIKKWSNWVKRQIHSMRNKNQFLHSMNKYIMKCDYFITPQKSLNATMVPTMDLTKA